jgi:signal transduction histidine kinase
MSERQKTVGGWSFVLDEPLRLLVVDDDPILREFASVYLSAPNVTIDVAEDGEEAWTCLSSRHYDVALVDIEMPRLDGYGLVERIRRHESLHDLPVIMVTGREDAVSIDRAFEVGANSFAVKPVNWRQLSHQVRYVVRSGRMEQAARRARDQALVMGQMKSDILTLMRHEFRTPLNSIIGFSKLIESQALGPLGQEGYVEHARYVRSAGEGLLGLFTDLMLYSELSSGEREIREDEYALASIAMRAIAQVEAAHGALRGARAIDEKLVILGDRELLERILSHLIANAVSHGGGLTALSIGVDGAGAVLIEVRDSGAGFTADQIEACMEPFHQGDGGLARRSTGLGLGLPMVKLAAELHGGSLEIVPSDAAGACIRVHLPAARIVAMAEQAAA